MRILAFCCHKGGSGKSTMVSSLAVTASQTGEKVFVIDLDPQKSLVRWSRQRASQDIPVMSVPVSKLEMTLEELKAKQFTLVIIDTAGTDNIATQAAIHHADLCVIPARPNAFDLWACETTCKVIAECGKEYCFLLNQCQPAHHTARTQAGMDTLESLGALVAPCITARVDFQEATAYGFGVTEINPDGKAAAEMFMLWTSLKRRLTRAINKTSKKSGRKAA